MTIKQSVHSPTTEWIRSSYSTADGPDCVEVAATSSTIRVRDSKNVPGSGPQLGFTPAAWADFLSHTAGS